MEIIKEIYWEAYLIFFIIGLTLIYIGYKIQKTNENNISRGGNVLLVGVFIFGTSIITPLLTVFNEFPFYVKGILIVILILIGGIIFKERQ